MGSAVGIGVLSGAALAGCGEAQVVEVIKEVPVEKIVTQVVEKAVVQEKIVEKIVTVPAAPAQKEAITLLVWYDEWPANPFWPDLFKEFKTTHTNITVTGQAIPWSEHEQKILAGIAGGAVIDCVYTHPESNATMAAKGALMPLDDFIARGELDLGDFYPGALDYYRFRGKITGISYYSGPWLIYYNKDRIAEAGLEDPLALSEKGQWTRDKYTEYAQKLTKGEGADKIFGANRWYPQFDVSAPIMNGEGGEYFNEDATKTNINSDAGVRTFTWISDQVIKGWAPNPGDLAAFKAVPGGLFGSNKIGETICAKYCLDDWKEAPVKPYLGMVNMPVWTNGKEYTIDGPNGQGIFGGSKYKDEAWELLVYEATRGNDIMMTEGYSGPTRKSLARGAAWKATMRDWEVVEVYDHAAETVKAQYQPPGYREITSLVNAAYDEIVTGMKTVKPALDEVAPKIDSILKEMAS